MSQLVILHTPGEVFIVFYNFFNYVIFVVTLNNVASWLSVIIIVRSPEISSTSQLTQNNRPTSSVATASVDSNNNHRRSRSNPEITNNVNQPYNIVNDTNTQLQPQANMTMPTVSQQLTIPSPTTSQQRTTPSTPHHHLNKRNTTKVFSTATFKPLSTSKKVVTLLKKASSRQAAHEFVGSIHLLIYRSICR